MSPQGVERRRAILENAEALLPNHNFGEGHNFILSRQEALEFGDAVASRNYKKINCLLDGAVDQLEDHYETLTIEELKPNWNRALQEATGTESDILDFIDKREMNLLLDDVLAQRDGAKPLHLKPITHIKLLETLVYASAPDAMSNFDPRYATAPRHRKKRGAIFARSLNQFESLCIHEPGVRRVREKLLSGDESALDAYLAEYSRMQLAKKAYADIIETFESGKAAEKKRAVRNQLETASNFDELLSTHILNWEMLPADIMITDSRTRNKIIRELITDHSNEKQRRTIENNWSDERIDILFSTASLATQQGRRADIYISNTFDSGCGVYLAAALSHPIDSNKAVVVADNPIHGNALYTVDELLTEFDETTDQQYTWQQVLGSHKRVARVRGARRRYHTGDWSQVPQAVCEYGGNYELTRQKQLEHAKEPEGNTSREVSIHKKLMETIAKAHQLSSEVIDS